MTSTRSASIPAERFVALVGLLNREVRMLERLVFKLTETELLAAASETRFMGLMLDEVDDITSDLGGIEVARSMLVADLAEALGLDHDVSLQELIAYSPADTSPLLTDLRERLIAATADLERVAASGSATTQSKLSKVAGTLAGLEPAARGIGRYGEFSRHAADPVATTFDLPA